MVAEAGVLVREEAALDELTEAAALDAARQETLEKELAGIREQEAAPRARLDEDRRQLVALDAALEVAPEGDALARVREESAQQRQGPGRVPARNRSGWTGSGPGYWLRGRRLKNDCAG